MDLQERQQSAHAQQDTDVKVPKTQPKTELFKTIEMKRCKELHAILLNDDRPFLPPPQARVSGIAAQERGLAAKQVGFEVVLFVRQIVVRETYLVCSPRLSMGAVLMPL